jgi:anti-sigma-K factor RskA
VAAVLVAGLVLWGVQLERRLALLAPDVGLGELVRVPAGLLVELVGTGKPGASGRLLVAADGGRAALVVTGLAPLPAHRVYQLWFAQAGERPVTGGAFRVNPRGEAAAAVSVPMPIAKARAIAVTEEPAPMSPAPTGAHLLDLRAR